MLVDARPAATAAEGAIPGAVSIPPSAVRAAVAGFPAAKLKAPIIVYDGDGGNSALVVAQVIKESGQPNVTVHRRRLRRVEEREGPGRDRARCRPRSRTCRSRVPARSPTTSSSSSRRRRRPDVLILDVRNTDEANAGMIKGAMLIPDEELLARMGEVPKDKRIITHCSTGVRAEMAYHKLKDGGLQRRASSTPRSTSRRTARSR